MTEFVRAKDPKTGHEVSVTRQFAEGYKLEVLDKDAVDANGRPLPAKPNVELPKVAQPADDNKEGGKTR